MGKVAAVAHEQDSDGHIRREVHGQRVVTNDCEVTGAPSGQPLWAFPQPEPNPYRLEWEDLVDAVRKNKPYNEVKRGVEASVTTSMGRMAAHTGQEITFDQMLNCPHEFAAGVASLSNDGAAPVQADANGKYPIPEPGKKKDREY